MVTSTGHDFTTDRRQMVAHQIEARGMRDRTVLDAFLSVPREAFVPERLAEFAYEDTPLPIGEEQTISQPYIVAVMAEALELNPKDHVLEIGTGSGYAAAILSRLAAQIYTVERIELLAEEARRRLAALRFRNVHVLHGDGSLGWPEHAPYDAIVVAAGGPELPPALLSQLSLGGRLVMPVGSTPRMQRLVRVRRTGASDFKREELGQVRFVPLIGAEGWQEQEEATAVRRGSASRPAAIANLIRETAEPLSSIEEAPIEPLLERIGDARVVLLGESTHGTSEFYRMRARITRHLIERRGFNIVAIEADWPDAATVDAYVRHMPPSRTPRAAFQRFPRWMWRNEEVKAFVEWLRSWNGAATAAQQRTGFYGLDLYSLQGSIDAVLAYLDKVDPDSARLARRRYGCLSAWEADPAAYGEAAVTGAYRSCEGEVVATLKDMLESQLEYASDDGERFLDAVQNARLVANCERYYRAMYYGSRESWNLRDQHMFDTLETLLGSRGPGSKAVVWAHNSHVGDASATEMGARGELNVGYLVRKQYGNAAYTVGFGTDHGTVAAASEWGGPMESMRVRPAHPESYEGLCHWARTGAFFLHLRDPARKAVREELLQPRLERAIGVIYRPETELLSHYFQAVLPSQFDEYVWFDETAAVSPLRGGASAASANPFEP